jgi:hypothetical protein
MIDWLGFFFGGWGSPFSAYVALQTLALATLWRPLKYVALVPLPIMLWIAVLTFQAFHEHSNAWPLLLILVSPVAALALGVLEIVGVWRQSQPHRIVLISLTLAILVAGALAGARMFGMSE